MGTDLGGGFGFWPLTPDPSPPAGARGIGWLRGVGFSTTDERSWGRIGGLGLRGASD